MDAGSQPSVEGIKQSLRSKGGTLVCPLCGSEEFVLHEVSVLGAGRSEGYGTRRERRAQLVCKNCGGVVSLDLSVLQDTGGGSS